jgi:hypothetical protein
MWLPAKVIYRHCLATARAAARAIRSAPERVEHRGFVGGATGGSLANTVTRTGFVVLRRWGAVLKWSTLGQAGLFFRDGTPRQKPRPFETAPAVPPLVADIRADAVQHYAARARRVGRAA